MSYAPFLTENTINSTATYTPTTSVLQSRKHLKSSPKRPAKTKKSAAKRGLSSNYPIIVHCHLCWDWVWQRPQQFISRLSKRHRILFVETRPPDPALVTPLARCETLEAFPNLTLLRLQFPASRWEDAAYV